MRTVPSTSPSTDDAAAAAIQFETDLLGRGNLPTPDGYTE